MLMLTAQAGAPRRSRRRTGGLLTVDELQTQRQARARVNHETYKGLLAQAQGRIRARALNDCKDLLWQVPPLVPGRPLYKTSHAARYVADKLRLGGFSVEVASSRDVHVLYVSWNAPVATRAAAHAASRRRREEGTERVARGGSSRPADTGRTIPNDHVSVEEASRRLDRLKATLGLS
jgi:hypothetical protein